MRLEGNSSSLMTTLSPDFQSSPWATTDRASEVFLSRETSSAWAPIRLPRAWRRRASVAIHRG